MALELLSVAEFAQRTSTSQWTIRWHIKAGYLKFTRVGRRILVPSTEVDRVAAHGLPSIPVVSKHGTAAEATAL